MRTTVVNVRGRTAAALADVVYVGRAMPRHPVEAIRRGSPLGNPFKVGQDGTLQEVLAKYLRHVQASPDLLALLPGLKGKRLGCWCCDDADGLQPIRCHAQVLMELCNQGV
jgi:hypothetical protein